MLRFNDLVFADSGLKRTRLAHAKVSSKGLYSLVWEYPTSAESNTKVFSKRLVDQPGLTGRKCHGGEKKWNFLIRFACNGKRRKLGLASSKYQSEGKHPCKFLFFPFAKESI